MRERGGLRCALEECGELCVTEVGTTLMPVWCAGSWVSKWMYQGDVSLFLSLGLEKCKAHGASIHVEKHAILFLLYRSHYISQFTIWTRKWLHISE